MPRRGRAGKDIPAIPHRAFAELQRGDSPRTQACGENLANRSSVTAEIGVTVARPPGTGVAGVDAAREALRAATARDTSMQWGFNEAAGARGAAGAFVVTLVIYDLSQ